MSPSEAVDTYVNGNISDFKEWLKNASALNVLDAVEYYSGNYGQRHLIINIMRFYLELM
jgi:hypothetical protein